MQDLITLSAVISKPLVDERKIPLHKAQYKHIRHKLEEGSVCVCVCVFFYSFRMCNVFLCMFDLREDLHYLYDQRGGRAADRERKKKR